MLLGPAERAEVIVDFAGAAGQRGGAARAVPRHDGRRGARRAPLRRAADAVPGRPATAPDATRVPAQAAAAAGLDAGGEQARPTGHWVITLGGAFYPELADQRQDLQPGAAPTPIPVLGTTETWQITNKTKVAHVIHIHHTDWYMLARNGRPPKPWEDCLKETFFVEPGETILVAGHFSDFTGKYVIHCHMLDHEDHGLMTQFEVVEAAAQPAGDEVARRRRGEIPAHSAPASLGLPDGSPPGATAVELHSGRPGGRAAEPARARGQRRGPTLARGLGDRPPAPPAARGRAADPGDRGRPHRRRPPPQRHARLPQPGSRLRPAHTVGGQGKSGAKPARSRHCDRAEGRRGPERAGHWGRHRLPGKARRRSRKPGDLSPAEPTTTLEEGVA